MHSGPIHGIHPGQTTAVMVDGFGPFDLPVNDYVEPAGGRGYDPEAFAALVEEALHRIAVVHFADGPARARMAFAEAHAEAVVTEPVRERLGRAPEAQEHARFIVRSGTFGQQSRVEFVCPGRRDDPRGHQGDNVMNRMCPTKYASEASAGLGVTGRWPGYAEFRGNERLGLARALGWTRSDDAVGRDVLATELRIVAWIAVALVVGLVALPRVRAAAGLSMLAGTVGVGALVLALALALAGDGAAVQVAIVESARGGVVDGAPPWSLAWLPALLLVGGIPAFGADADRPERDGGQWAARIAATMVAVTVLLLASNLAGLGFVVPSLHGEVDGELALQQWIAGAAEATGERFGLSILEVEGAIASAVVAGLLGGMGHVVRAVAAAARRLAPEDADRSRDPLGPAAAGRRSAMLAVLALAASAAAVIVSRKTFGGAALVPGAIGLTLVLQGGLSVCRGRRFAVLLLPGWAALALGCVGYAAASLDPHPFVFLCVLAGSLATLASLALPFLSRSQPGA
jgi:hypothetical protein